MTTSFTTTSPFAMQPTLLAGPNTGNVMGLGAAPVAASPSPASSFGGWGGVAMSGIGAVAQAVGAYYSAKSAKSSLKHQGRMLEIGAQMAKTNARINELGAQSALLQGQRQEQAVRLNTAQMKSAQRTGFASRGVALDSGSVQNILNTTDYMGEVDALTVQRNAAMAAFGYRVQGTNAMTQAASARGAAAMASADASGINPFGSAATSLLGSAPQVASHWYARRRMVGG